MFCLFLAKCWNNFGKNCALGQIWIVLNGQILNANLAIWSHCSEEIRMETGEKT